MMAKCEAASVASKADEVLKAIDDAVERLATLDYEALQTVREVCDQGGVEAARLG